MTHAAVVGEATRPRGIERQRTRSETIRLAAFIGVHAPLGLLVFRVPSLAALHALIAFAVGIWAALRWRPQRVASVAAYIAGGAVLWRMAGAPIFWEFGKYAITGIFLTAIVRLGRSAKWRLLPLLYFAALLPSIAIVLNDPNVTLSRAIDMVSFNLSGPLALFVSSWFLSQVRLTPTDTRRVLVSLIAPIVGIAAVTLVTTYTASHLSFTDESNFVTSGGFGPNEVSVILGLGALAALLYSLDVNVERGAKWIALAVMLLLSMQSAMTFSRGGLYSFGGAALIASWYLMKDRQLRRRLVLIVVGCGLLASFIILPRLEAVTGGALSTRFEDAGSTHRAEIVAADIGIWLEHPAFGVGVGKARDYRNTASTMSHTEYSRMLSEHGMLGLFALVMLVAMCVQQVRRLHSARDKALAVAFLSWSLLSMLHVAMRVAALGFVFGLGQAMFCMREESAMGARKRAPLDGLTDPLRPKAAPVRTPTSSPS